MKIFISWSGAPSGKIASVLKKWIPKVIQKADIYVSSEDIPPGEWWTWNLAKHLVEADYGIICIDRSNVDEPWLIFEAGVLSKSFISNHVCPFILDLEPKEVKDPLGKLQCVEYTEKNIRRLVVTLNELNLKIPINQLGKTFRSKWPALKHFLDRLQQDVARGKFKSSKERKQIPEEQPADVINPEELLKSKTRRTDEVFAIEYLRQPIKLERNKKGHVTVKVDRNGVQEMVYSNKGKMAMAERHVTNKNKKELIRLDREIQSFLADGGPPDKLTINLPRLPQRLRWASGGVLSIITDEHGDRWVPLFFRDIRPYGWNIALGTTERWFKKDKKGNSTFLDGNYTLENDLNYPHTFIIREFLEETLIVNGTPKLGGTLYYKSFQFLGRKSTFSETRAKRFYEDHCILRKAKEEDRLNIKKKGKTKARLLDTDCTLIVHSDEDYHMDHVLICFSLLDLGIEVVEVAEYNLAKGDWILDGEIREKHDTKTGETKKELIRMPVALLCLKYLRDIFGPGEDWHRYTFGPQPSIRVRRPPDPETEIKYFPFDWDAKRRMQAVEGEWDAKSMKIRYIDWYDKFGKHFIKEREKPDDKWGISYAHPSQLFIPGTAKILNLYFSTIDRKEKK